jgi:uncharacterized DUF497 family protein
MLPKKLLQAAEFEWGSGNIEKNWLKHGVSPLECEEIFFNQPLIVAHDEAHSVEELRYYALGRTEQDRNLFVVFTLRGDRIRIISARDMNRKERELYGS